MRNSSSSSTVLTVLTALRVLMYVSLADTLSGDSLFVLPRYRPQKLSFLAEQSNFTKHEIRLMYQGFKQVRTVIIR